MLNSPGNVLAEYGHDEFAEEFFMRYYKFDDWTEMYEAFEKWLDKALAQPFPEGLEAVSFNIYEDVGDGYWSMDFVGTDRFDPDDDGDWACFEITTFDTRDEPFGWITHKEWEDIEKEAIDMVMKYLECGKYAGKLKECRGVGLGHVEGDLNLLYKKE